MKSGQSLVRKYGPALGLLFLMVFLMIYAFLPAFQMNRRLNRFRDRRLREIGLFKEKEKQCLRMIDALEGDPITVENHLRRRFDGAKREGEVDVNRLAR